MYITKNQIKNKTINLGENYPSGRNICSKMYSRTTKN